MARGIFQIVQHRFLNGEQLTAVGTHAVKGAAADQTIHRAAVHISAVKPLAKIIKRAIDAPRAFTDDLLDKRLAEILNRQKAVTNIAAAYRKGEIALVDVGRQNVDAEAAALCGIGSELVLTIEDAGKQRRHILARIVAFEPRRLIGNRSIGGGVGLIEGIGGKALHLTEHGSGCSLVNTAAHAALHYHIAVFVGHTVDKNGAFALHDVMLFLAHGAAHDVCSAEAIARQLTEYLHDLLLINNAAISDVENPPEPLMLIADVRGVMTAVYVGGNAIHRTGTVKRQHSDQVLHTVRVQLGENIFHSLALKLKNTLRCAARNHREHLGVVLFYVVRRIGRVGARNQLLCVVYDGEVAQPQKINFQQSQLLESRHGKLRDDVVIVLGERHIVGHRPVRDDNACRVHCRMARHTLYFFCDVD